MKYLFNIAFIIIFTNWSFSQIDENKIYKNEFGVNVNVLLNAFISDKSDDPFTNLNVPVDQEWTAFYRNHYSPKNAIRLGFGVFNTESKDSSTFGSFRSIRDSELKYYAAFFGIQNNLNVSKIVTPYWGLDFFAKYSLLKSNLFQESVGAAFEWENTTITKTIDQQFGLSIPIGLQIFLNNRISISTESSFFLAFEKTIIETREIGSNTFEDKNSSDRTFINWKIPLMVIVNYRF